LQSEWGVRELFRIGSAGGEIEAETFGRILGVEMDGEGTIYVLDGIAASVRVFGSNGDYLQTIGGPGEGPGEFRRPNGLVITPDGRLWVSDTQSKRLTAFELDGTLLDTYPRGFITGVSYYWDAVSVGEGMIYESTTIWAPGNGAIERVYLGLRPGEAGIQPTDTILRPPELEKVLWNVGRTGTAGGPVEAGVVPVPFTPVVRDHLDPRGGFWAGTTDAMRFVRHSFDGDTIQIIEDSGLQPRPVTSLDRDRALEVLRDRFGEALLADEGQMPGIMPFWNDFFIDVEGRLWVERFRPPSREVLESRIWTVFSPEGVYMGAFNLPLESTPTPVIRNGRLVGIVRDSLNVEYVVVFALEPGRS
jgi:hypothetical protein